LADYTHLSKGWQGVIPWFSKDQRRNRKAREEREEKNKNLSELCVLRVKK
jgi:hypothetical protein